jgi:hypothetical protein
MAASLADVLDNMITESRGNIQRLTTCASQPLFPRVLYPVVIDVLQAEKLRLDMLRTAYEDLGEPWHIDRAG